MRTLQEKYNAVLEGNFSKTQFRRDAAIEMPQFVSTVNSFDDTVAILKNKGIVTEAKAQEPEYSTAKPADTIAPDVLDTGIKFELDKKYGTLDVTPEQYEKAKEAAIKNLSKDVLYYVKQDSIQLDTPGEKMEKAKLKEVKVKVAIPGQDEFEAEEGKDYSEEEAEEYVKNAKASGATPMNTKFKIEEDAKAEAWKEFQEKHNVTDKTVKVAREDFEKEWEAGNLKETVDTDDLRAKIANILKGQLSSLNKMGGDAIIEDYLETQIQAYLDGDVDVEEPMEVVNDFREYMEHNQSAAADFNADLEPDDTTPETLEEDDEESPEDYANANAGSPMHAPPGLEEEDLSEPDVEDLYQHDQEYLDTLKKRKALKEMFKKIIVNLINE